MTKKITIEISDDKYQQLELLATRMNDNNWTAKTEASSILHHGIYEKIMMLKSLEELTKRVEELNNERLRERE